VRRAFEAAGIRVLEDDAVPVGDGSRRFWLAGVGDFWETRHDVQRALADVPNGAPVIVFTHNPDLFPHVPARVALTIAAHTHGGQVALPVVGRLIVPSHYGQRYAVGLVQEDDRQLFVTPRSRHEHRSRALPRAARGVGADREGRAPGSLTSHLY
jgi:predicted MPP superfamily phosphohydrolase